MGLREDCAVEELRMQGGRAVGQAGEGDNYISGREQGASRRRRRRMRRRRGWHIASPFHTANSTKLSARWSLPLSLRGTSCAGLSRIPVLPFKSARSCPFRGPRRSIETLVNRTLVHLRSVWMRWRKKQSRYTSTAPAAFAAFAAAAT